MGIFKIYVYLKTRVYFEATRALHVSRLRAVGAQDEELYILQQSSPLEKRVSGKVGSAGVHK